MARSLIRASTQIRFDSAVAYASEQTFSSDQHLVSKKYVDDGTWKYLIQDVLSADIASPSAATVVPNTGAGSGAAYNIAVEFAVGTTAGAISTASSGIPVLLEASTGNSAPSNHGFNTAANATGEYFNTATIPGEYRIELLNADGDEILDAANGDNRVWAVLTTAVRDTTESNYELRFFSGEWNGSAGALMTAYTMNVAFKMLYPQIVAFTSLSRSALRTGQANISAEAAQLAATQVDAAHLGSDVAGDGLQGGNGVALAVDVSAFAGTGLQDDGSENLRIAAAAAGNGLTGGGGSALSVDPDGTTGGNVAAVSVGANGVGLDVSGIVGSGLEADGAGNLRIAAAAAGNGLSGGNGSALALDLNELSAAAIDVANDYIAIIDATDNSSKKEQWADVVAGIAGSGITATNGVLSAGGGALSGTAAGVVNVANDTFIFIDADDSSANKQEAVADLITAIAGTGLAASSGVLAVDLSEFSDVQIASGDKFVLLDSDGSTEQLETVDDVATFMAGDGIVATAGSMAINMYKNDYAASLNGSTVAFTLTAAPVSDSFLMVFLNGQLQQAGVSSDYTISSATLTMSSAPVAGDDLIAVYFAA